MESCITMVNDVINQELANRKCQWDHLDVGWTLVNYNGIGKKISNNYFNLKCTISQNESKRDARHLFKTNKHKLTLNANLINCWMITGLTFWPHRNSNLHSIEQQHSFGDRHGANTTINQKQIRNEMNGQGMSLGKWIIVWMNHTLLKMETSVRIM